MVPDTPQPCSAAGQLQAIVLAGGLGTRLRTVVADVPKPLAPIGGRPFLSFVFDDLVEHGFEIVVVAVSWLRDLIIGEFGERYRGLQLRYSVEPEPLGTGGAIRQAFNYVDIDRVFVLNGDTLQHCPYRRMLQLAEQEDADAVVVVRALDNADRYATVELEGNRITKFSDKRAGGPGLINAGAYLVHRRLIENPNLGQVFSFEHDILLPGAQSRAILACQSEGPFIDIGVAEDYARAGCEIPKWPSKRDP